MSQEIPVAAQSSENAVQNRFRGALLGVAIGDALGGPLEFQPARDPNNYVTEMIGGGWLQLAPGMGTDDTQMARASVESLLAKKVFDPDDIAARLVAWMQTNPPDIGVHTAQVLAAIGRGEPWETVTRRAYEADPDNASNGSLTRSSPLALFFYRNPDYVAGLSPVMSRITHAHPDCESACVALNVAIACLVLGETKTGAVEIATAACHTASPGLRERLHRALSTRNETTPTDWVLDTLEVAFWALLHTNSFEAALIAVINRGADADTVGAVTGALAGAYYGLSAIPERWLAVLHARDALLAEADALFALAQTS